MHNTPSCGQTNGECCNDARVVGCCGVEFGSDDPSIYSRFVDRRFGRGFTRGDPHRRDAGGCRADASGRTERLPPGPAGSAVASAQTASPTSGSRVAVRTRCRSAALSPRGVDLDGEQVLRVRDR